ncbi:MAG: ATPase [Tannerella sp.]|jgi:N-acetylglucosamine kinase-like BadF-type ATPase|nr:ATPase [Tannerella sp.]
MILIADSGSTKTCWRLVRNGTEINNTQTAGLNPYFQPEEDIALCIAGEAVPRLHVDASAIRTVYFYGAGCVYDKVEVMRRAIAHSLPAAAIEVNTDLLGAARALCGREAGIACILGTGSNSCFYDGRQIVRNVSPLGFILGDEGSGADLGKHLIGNLMKDMMPSGLKEKFLEQYGLTLPEIIDRVYCQPYPNRFLASFSPFLLQNAGEPSVRKLALDCFKSFFVRNVSKYDFSLHKVNFAGTIAFHFRDILEEAASRAGFCIGLVVASPADRLIAYHSYSQQTCRSEK